MTHKSREADVAFISALAELLRKNDLTELQVKRDYAEDGSLNVRVSRHVGAVVTQTAAPTSPAQASFAPPQDGASAAEPPVSDPADHPGAVTSPMVGTVYMQAEPGAEPFISVGAEVSEGDTLLIVEAMKTMNHIPAPRSGRISRILVEDGAAVEFGAPLVILD
jgi:acetyl-CoA carboxylase biotin carboxyl carrier protein